MNRSAINMVKCRAKEKGTNKWVYGYICPIDKENFVMCCIDKDGNVTQKEIDNKTISVCTYICDLNGDYIYQGDLVRRIRRNGDILYQTFEEVAFSKNESGWVSNENRRLTDKSVEREKIIISGNIFQ